MRDIRTSTPVRIVSPVRWDYAPALAVRTRRAAEVNNVTSNGRDIPFAVTASEDELRIPYSWVPASGGTVVLHLTDGTSESYTAPLPGDPSMQGSVRVTDLAVLVETSTAELPAEILIDGSAAVFVRVSARVFLVLLGAGASVVAEVSIVYPTRTGGTSSTYKFGVGLSGFISSGREKATSQLVKALLTTPGSNAFNRNAAAAGVGVGSVVARANESASEALIVAKIQTAAAMLVASHLSSDLPADEKIVSVVVLSVESTSGDQAGAAVRVRLQVTFLDSVSFNFGLNA